MGEGQETVDMATTTRLCIAFSLMSIASLILGGCNDGAAPSTAAAPSSTSSTSNTLSISGNPAQFVEIGSSYEFRPSVSNAATAALMFSIQNKPSWATFDPTTGTLAGTPEPANAGTSGSILISVSDGGTSSALAPFSIDVVQSATAGAASLSWLSPPANSNGTLEVEGYHIYFGNSATNLTHVVNVESPSATSFVINNLPAGTWYFGIAAYNVEKVESSLSAIVGAAI
jgi:Putative Ig domain